MKEKRPTLSQADLYDVLHGQNEALKLAYQNAPLKSVLEVLILTAEKVSPSKAIGSILLADEKREKLSCFCAPHLPPAYCTAINNIPIKEYSGSCGTAAFRGESVFSNHIESDPLWKDYKDYAIAHGLFACWSTPIKSSLGEILGAFALYYDAPIEPTDREREIVDLLTNTASIIISKRQQVDKNQKIQRQLAQSNYRYELACRATKDVIWEWDLTTHQINWNEAIISQLKYSRDHLSTHSNWWYENIHPADAARVKEGIQNKMRRGEEEWQDEYRFRCGDGSYGIFLDRGYIIYDETGQPIRMIGAMESVTEARDNDRKLKESETHFRALSEAAPQMLFIADANGNLTYYNQRFMDYVGTTFEEIKDWDWVKKPLHHPDDLQMTIQKWQHSLATGEPYEVQYRIRRKDGEFRWHLGRAVAIKDENGNIMNWYGTNTDIHDQKILEDSVKINEQRLTQAVNAAQLGFWEYDLKTQQLHWSEILEQICGADEDQDDLCGDLQEMIKKRVFPGDMSRSYEAMQKCASDREPYKIQIRIMPKPDEIRWVEFSGECIVDENDQVVKLVGTGLNVTERKLADQEILLAKDTAERASNAKSVFLANMSHEIRTPLGAITGFAGLLRDPTISKERFDEYLSVINRNSEQLLRIVDDILDISKVESGKLEIENFEFSISDVLDDFCALMDFKARAKGIEFLSKMDDSIPSLIRSDAPRIRQILTNIVGNAIKFTDQGTVELQTSFQDGKLMFLVKDTGLGISHEQASSLFQPFHQADASTTRRFGGTGLGLALTRNLCEAMGGTFELVSSELGKGSTFLATISVEVIDSFDNGRNLSLLPNGNASLSTGRALQGMNLLVVDDSDDTRLLIGSMLERLGAKVFSSSNGLEGYQMAMSKKCDFVFMDIQMPVMDGYEATKKLRSDGYQGPIIAVTAHAMQEERNRALENGFTDFMTKPVRQKDFLDTITRHTPSHTVFSDSIH